MRGPRRCERPCPRPDRKPVASRWDCRLTGVNHGPDPWLPGFRCSSLCTDDVAGLPNPGVAAGAYRARNLATSVKERNSTARVKTGMKTNPVQFLKAQPRLLTAVLVGALLWLFLPRALPTSTRLLLAWDGATGVYLFTALVMLSRSNIDRIRYRALLQDEGQIVILGLTSITAVSSAWEGSWRNWPRPNRSRVTMSGGMSGLRGLQYYYHGRLCT